MQDNHNRVLASGLLVIERRLHQIGQDLRQVGEESDSILESTINDIDPKMRKRVIAVVQSMLDEINQIKELFNLEPAKKSLRWEITTMLSEIWTILEDLRPEKISGAYGHMSDGAQHALRPRITRLLDMLDELDRELG